MNIDNLHDALNQLDDDLIQEVEVLRSERRQQTKKRGGKWIVRWTSLAAGFVIFVVSAYAVSTLFLRGFGGSKKSDSSVMVEENIKEESAGVGEDNNDSAQQQGNVVSDNTSVATGESKTQESKTEAYEVKVEITSWQKDGFTGIVKESADTETYTVGTELTVLLNENNTVGDNSAIGMKHNDDLFDSTEFPVGSVVIVRFMMQGNTESSSETNTGSENIVLYADSVTPDDAE